MSMLPFSLFLLQLLPVEEPGLFFSIPNVFKTLMIASVAARFLVFLWCRDEVMIVRDVAETGSAICIIGGIDA